MQNCVRFLDLEKHFIPKIRSEGIVKCDFPDLATLERLLYTEPSETLGGMFNKKSAVQTRCNVILTYCDSIPSSEELAAIPLEIRNVIEKVAGKASIVLPPGFVLPVDTNDTHSDFPKAWEMSPNDISMSLGFEFLRLLWEFRSSTRTDILPILRRYYQLFQDFDQMNRVLSRATHFIASPEDPQKIEIVSVIKEKASTNLQ